MEYATTEFALTVINNLRKDVFPDPDLFHAAETAYRRMVSEHTCEDMENTSSVAVEKLVDDILSIEDPVRLHVLVYRQNLNLLAFLARRFLHAQTVLAEQPDKLLPVENRPTSLARWALVDLWQQSPRSSDRY